MRTDVFDSLDLVSIPEKSDTTNSDQDLGTLPIREIFEFSDIFVGQDQSL